MAEDWNIIFSYTRKQAIEDGVLIDVTEQANRLGFKVNTCVTGHLYGDYLAPPAGLAGEGQSLEGRLHDLLFRTLIAAKSSSAGDRVEFDVLFLMKPGRWDTVHVLAIMGPGDHGEPVLTIMLPEDE
ncbi:DUF6573 family protein [Solidesulfovibrio magneticus]|uniref:DNA or RNA helicases of superfamily II n=1 Tax=Solidesulfovibrio magneticus (strain ATCC 700980 / DSM 13731 / RS-1) TaxID=573370 RepID=C4XJG2_SOLM1|nr:DUF6573 family protein [Solidesulfovibrio magneticus]BAH76712.1 hypothetical protein DMR_32210 [Solidesulfovibrio magneticus RS-1]